MLPQNPAPRASLAEMFLAEGQPDMAEQTLRDAGTALKDNPAGYRMLGEFYLSQRKLDQAGAEFASLHAAHPKDVAVTKTYIGILLDQGHLDEAANLNDELLKDSPSDPDGMVFRGEILTRQGKPNDAVPVLEAAVKDAPDNPLGHYNLGVAYAGASNFGQAQSEWQKAAQLRPDMPEPQRALAAYALRKGDTDLLKNSSEQLIKIEPRSPEGYLFHSAALFAKRGQGGGSRSEEGDRNRAPGCNRLCTYGRLASFPEAVR